MIQKSIQTWSFAWRFVCRIWGYAPGIITDGRHRPANVEALTGVPMACKELTVKAMNGWRSVFSPAPNLSAHALRQLAREAGVHIYCDAGEPRYANGRLIALHSVQGGTRTIVLPKRYRQVRELFSGRLIAENAKSFEDTLTSPCTVLYALETE